METIAEGIGVLATIGVPLGLRMFGLGRAMRWLGITLVVHGHSAIQAGHDWDKRAAKRATDRAMLVDQHLGEVRS